jgi:poly(A) polymerase
VIYFTGMHYLAEIKTENTSGLMSAGEKSPENFSSRLVKNELASLFTGLNEYLAREGTGAFIVGGYIRDALLGRETADIDIAVAGDSLEIASRLADALGGKYVPLDEINRIGRIVLPGKETPFAAEQRVIDFSQFSGAIETDLTRRDFTIDAMAVPLKPLAEGDSNIRIIDPAGGLDDLSAGIIRVVSPTALPTDPVRLLRGVRLAYELGFSIDAGTEAMMKQHASRVAEVAGERVREELLRLLGLPRTEELLFHLDRLGLLTAMIPELDWEKGVEQPREHFWNVFNHSLRTVAAVDFVLHRGDWGYGGSEALAMVPWSDKLDEYFTQKVSHGSTRRVLLKIAALLHDVAKPQTKTTEDDGRVRFLGHGPQGAEITAAILERLRFTARERKLAATMVEHHLRPTQLSQEGMPSSRAIYRYFRDTAEAGIDILFLSLADHLATRGPNFIMSNWREHTRLVDYVLTKRFAEPSPAAPPKLVSGHDLIRAFGLEPGPEVGALLEAVREAQAAGELSTREAALAYVKRRLRIKGEGYDQKK